MISPAAKIEMVLELLNSGMLCKCDNRQHGLDENDERNSELLHYPDCEGQEKAMNILSAGVKND